MGTSPDQMRSEIEATRGRLATDVGRLTERTSPRRMARRRTARMRGAVSGMRNRVMGTAYDTAYGVRDTAQSAAGSLQEGTGQAVGSARDAAEHAAGAARDMAEQTGHAVQQTPDMARSQTQGNPLAAGLVAFGVGLLASSLVPASRAERQKASELMHSEALEPVKQAATESAQHLKEGAKEVTQGAAGDM